MPLKINGSTSGSVTLAAPATGSDVTLTLPTTALATLASPTFTGNVVLPDTTTIGGGTTLGAWTAYTPTLGGWTQGNGTVEGRYMKIGKTVHFRAIFTFGSTSAAAANDVTFTLPSTRYENTQGINANGFFRDSTPGVNYMGNVLAISSTVVRVGIIGASGVYTAPSTTTPFTWAVNDQVLLYGTYEEV